MSAELDALHAAEAVLKAAEAKLAVAEAPTPPLRTDGPTLEEYVKAGYSADHYPPAGYAPRVAPEAESVYLGHIGEPAVQDKDY